MRVRRLVLRPCFAALVALIVSAIFAAPAGASYHLMKIRAVFLGPTTDSSFLELQMTGPGQNLVMGQVINIYNKTGGNLVSYPLSANVANANNQDTILIGDTAAGGSPDFSIPSFGDDLHTANGTGGGAVCYGTIDCFSWGSFTGQGSLPSPDTSPAASLSTTMVDIRTIAPGCPTLLEEADDTNSSNVDFSFGFFTPRNNSVTPTETLCPVATPVTTTTKKKCKKKKKHHSAQVAKKKKCKKKKKH